ncbi:DF family (seleno)protein [Demequina zhanjiangensis]|uniref:Thioredoxin family protein n=1 Tax=Demequina zhanjiangensis TaxID=3051659 RepID=A0ABT8FY59_9MICO|nr:thioredoxin family protein [Demequina sp. SYSU T00b26]MDN4471833.1 thioredoxin family protein [Demequina sp. SYSU T00b26]
MRVQLLYFDGCPSWREAEARLIRALSRVCATSTVERVLVTDEGHAAELAFPGSPTLRLDGRDLFPVADATVGLACRVYETPDGMQGAPTVEQLVEALATAGRAAA